MNSFEVFMVAVAVAVVGVVAVVGGVVGIAYEKGRHSGWVQCSKVVREMLSREAKGGEGKC